MTNYNQNYEPAPANEMYMPDLELSVISTCIFNPGLIAHVRGSLNINSFSADNFKIIQAIYQLYDASEQLNKASITAKLAAGKALTAKAQKILDNYAIYKDVQNFKDYADKIQVAYQKRHIKQILESALQELDTAGSAEGFAMLLEERLNSITTEQTEQGIKTLHEAVVEAIEDGIARRTIPGISTGYADLDFLIGGFYSGALWYLSARSGTGKTTIALELLNQVASQGVPVAFFSLEMYSKRIGSKLISGKTGISRRDILNGRFDEKQNNLLTSIGEVEKLPFYIVDDVYSMNAIEEKIGILAKKHGVKIVAIDYLGLIERKSDDEMNDITRELKLMSKRYGVDIIILIQMVKLDKATKPTVKHLRYIDIQDADVVLLAYEDVYEDVIPDKIDDGVYNVVWEIAKNRELGVLGCLKRVYDNRKDKYFKSVEAFRGGATDEIPAAYDPIIKGQRNELIVNDSLLF